MSLRKQAKILRISPPYLSLLLNGKRPWRGNLKERYLELVNTFVNTPEAITPLPKASKDDFVSEKSVGGAEGNRTPDPLNAIEVLSLAELQPHTAFKYSKHRWQAQEKTQTLPASPTQIDILNRPH